VASPRRDDAAVGWASELAVAGDDAKAAIGWAALRALASSEMLQADDIEMVVAVTDAVLAREVGVYRENQLRHEVRDVEVDEGRGREP
jgi:hypothetical protein